MNILFRLMGERTLRTVRAANAHFGLVPRFPRCPSADLRSEWEQLRSMLAGAQVVTDADRTMLEILASDMQLYAHLLGKLRRPAIGAEETQLLVAILGETLRRVTMDARRFCLHVGSPAPRAPRAPRRRKLKVYRGA